MNGCMSRVGVRCLLSWTCAVALGAITVAEAAIQSPTELAGCVLWLDAADTGTITLTDGLVSEWRDKSGGAAHVSQSAATNRPASGVATLNGRNVVSFGGTNWLGGAAVLQQGDDTFSYFAVWMRADSGTGAGVVFEQSQTPQVNGTRAALLTVTSGGVKRYGFNGQSNDQNALGYYTPGSWVLSGLEIDGRTNRNVFLYSNSTNHVGTINMTTQNTGTSGTRVGCKLVNGAEVLNGQVAEIIVFDRVLADTDRNAVLYYLQEKWGLACGYQDCSMLIDFEHDRFPDGWVTNGEAFVTQPVCSTRKAFNPRGDWFVGTYEKDKTGSTTTQGDAPTGTLTGVSFVLTNNTVRARVGGGYLIGAGQECELQLERETSPGVWQVARKATGPADETMREIRWNVQGLAGQAVRFKVIDNYAGSWGHLNVDDIRVLNEPMPRALSAGFDGTALPSALILERPYQTPDAALTGTGTVRFALLSSTHDIWSTSSRGPRLLLNTIDDDAFSLETRLVSRSYTNAQNSAGLILFFEDPDANTFDPVMFGAYGSSGVRLEGPSIAVATNVMSGLVTDVRLQILGRSDKFTFRYSTDGEVWQTIRTEYLPGKKLIHAGLYCKDWGIPSALQVEFDYLNYMAEPVPKGTFIAIQ